MRLRLVIHRHSIPPVQILWTVAPTRPPSTAAGSSITVSQLLEQVNDIIPLESEDWGLEDYAVEVGGYECLHFSELGQILKDDEEVCIRALQTNDLRVRRISGRHQITSDGKHLIDGVAFGRPYLRRADRPAIRLPPRKRRRITYDEEENIDDRDEVNDRQIVVRTGFDDEDEAVAEDGSDDEEDFVPNDDEDGDLSAELEDLQNDVRAGANDDGGASIRDEESDTTKVAARRSRRSPKGLGLLRLLDENGHPFAGEYSNPLLDQYCQDEPTLKVRKRDLATLAKGARKSARNGVLDSSASPESVNRPDLAATNKSVRFDDNELATPATIQESVDSDEDDDFEPDEVGESDKENAEPQADESNSSDESSESSESSSLNFSEEIDSDETSSSGSSSSVSSRGSDSDSEAGHVSTKAPGHKSDSSDTSSSGPSSSSSDSDPETRQRTRKLGDAIQKATSSTLDKNMQPASTPQSAKQTPPGEGKNKTRSRNNRRRQRRKLDYLKREGFLEGEAAMRELHKFAKESKPQDPHLGDVEMRDDRADKAAADLDFEAKRQALLMTLREDNKTKNVGVEETGSRPNHEDTFAKTGKLSTLIDAGGIEANPAMDSQVKSQETTQTGGKLLGAEKAPKNAPSPRDETMIDALTSQKATTAKDEPMVNAPRSSATPNLHDEAMANAPMEAIDAGGAEERDALEDGPVETGDYALRSASWEKLTPSSQHRRSKLDLGGAKRMLFGSLGLRTPKTKEDESKTREQLMRDVRPVRVPQANNAVRVAEDLAAIAADESWKSKISLKAVECCHEGIELGTPPFPFVQRWDPQQRSGYNYGNSKKRKNKKRKRNNDNYYEETLYQESYNQSPAHDEHEALEGESDHPNANTLKDLREEHSSEGSLLDSQAVNEQLLRENGDVSAGTLVGNDQPSTDLPSLPKDPTTCPPLTREVAKVGTVIAFKQLEMSAETNWQPNISDYRTAMVDEITENGDLCMTPAKRDRRNKQAEYDERTGERLYSKFEMPGFNNDDGNENLEISFDELISPILLRAVNDQAQEGNEDLGMAEDHISSPGGTTGVASARVGRSTSEQQYSGLDGGANEVMEDEPIGSENRAEISELIKEAGWRSSVQSDVNGGLDARGNSMNLENDVDREDTTLIDPPSPRFNGFRSSPVVDIRSSPPLLESQSAKPLHASGTEIAESVPPQDPVESDVGSAVLESKSAIEYPSLPEVGDDSELFHQEAQHQSDPLFDHQILSQDRISNSMDQSSAESTRSRTHPFQESSPPKPIHSFDATGSEDEFPEPFSQAWENRMSQSWNIKPESSQEDAISPPSNRKIKTNGRHSSSQRESNRTWKSDSDWSALEDGDEDDGASTPRPSKSQMSSQIVDLTISSDTVDPVDSPYNGDDDSYKLPKGPGWVSKTRASKERSAPTRISSGKTKARSR